MIRILVFGASTNYGGTEAYLTTLYKLIDTSKIQFDFVFPHAADDIPYAREILSRGGNIYREYYTHSEKNTSNYSSPADILEKHPECDGVYLNVQKIDTTYRLLIAARKKGLRFRIIHAHSNDIRKLNLKHRLFKVWFMLTKRKTVTHYLTCAKGAGVNMFNEKAPIVIPNAVDFGRFEINEEIREKMRRKYNIKKDEIVIGFCGSLVYQKNPEKMIGIFTQIKKRGKYRLLLVGDGELKENVEIIAKKNNVFDSIIFAGAVMNTEDYYRMMDCFVLPSHSEGFGIVLLEAQAAGLRCYTTKNRVPYETNVTGRVTFIDENASDEEWAERIISSGFDRKNCIDVLMKSEYNLVSLKKKFYEIFGLNIL